MARFFVFSALFSTNFPSIDDFKQQLPDGAKLVGYNTTDLFYFMVGFDEPNDTYHTWVNSKDSDTRIQIGDGNWILFS